MRGKLGTIGLLVALGAPLAIGGWWTAAQADPAPPSPGTACTWGGTPANPTGTFTVSPGLTNTPLTAPARFYVTGDLAGDPGCTGTLTYIGQIDAGGTCSYTPFDGDAHGIPRVTRFAGTGVGPIGPARLYDRDGSLVASENADINTTENAPHFTECNTPKGFTEGNFSSAIVFAK